MRCFNNVAGCIILAAFMLMVSCSAKKPSKKTVTDPAPPTGVEQDSSEEHFQKKQSEIEKRFQKILRMREKQNIPETDNNQIFQEIGLRNTVRISIIKKKNSINIFSLGSIEIFKINRDSTIKIHTLRGKALVSIRNSLIELTVPGKVKPLATVSGVLLIKSRNSSNLIELEKRAYRGSIEIRRCPGGLRAINQVNVEDYLRGVVPNEMPVEDRSILEALKAQAVAARTYAMAHLNRYPDLGFDMFSDQRDQVYKGAKTEQYISDKAVAETAGLLLSYNGKLAKCYYHSTCGGTTADIHEVWSGKPLPYLTSQLDKDARGLAFCRKSSYTYWFEKWKLPQLSEIIKANLKQAKADNKLNFSKMLYMKVVKRTKSGRVKTLQIETDKGIIKIHGDKTRWALRRKSPNGPILYSSRFTIKVFGPDILIRGSGFGHGIGMCQYGAMGRARSGKKYYEILSAYYKGTNLVKISLEQNEPGY